MKEEKYLFFIKSVIFSLQNLYGIKWCHYGKGIHNIYYSYFNFYIILRDNI